MIISITKPPASLSSILTPTTRFHVSTRPPTITTTTHWSSPFPPRKSSSSSSSCKATLIEATDVPSSSSSSSKEYDEELEREIEKARIGARVRIKAPLKVYHIPRVEEVDLTGMEGVVKQYVAVWKGKRISANYPFKVELFTEVEGRGQVKFFAHLRDDEFEYLD